MNYSIVAYLLMQEGINLPAWKIEELTIYLAVGRKIPAIKLLKNWNDIGLKEAKDFVDTTITILSEVFSSACIIP